MKGSLPTGRKAYRPSTPWSVAEKPHGQIEVVGFPSGGKGDVRRWNPSVRPHRGLLQGRQLLPPPTRHTLGEPRGLRNKRRLLGQRHTTTECRELKKALHELADKGSRLLRQDQEPAPPPLRDEECSTKIVATIAEGIVKGMTRTMNRREHSFINYKMKHNSLQPTPK
ncbi:hypothetical protein Cgig2_007583 [Carnegiea gigantea]|uniref:Uncharacterized protein n=1 Tax=Carnegiea gigantea TaxID=171969 RepID=A0A9Q1Q9L9_9CARY|nr:hypothetical protein Cgig2_007583 [Carnegiea gigantea]